MENKNIDEENLNKNVDEEISEVEEGSYESEDDDTSMDLEVETTMDCEIKPLNSDLHEEDKRMLHEMVKQIASDYGGFNLDNAAMESLEETTAMFLIAFFEDANQFAVRQGRVTVKLEDIVSVARIRGLTLHKEDADNNNNN